MNATRTFFAVRQGVLGALGMCIALSGCARLNSVVRPEPPLLGRSMAAAADSKDRPGDKRPAPAPSTATAGKTDVYAQSFQRPKARLSEGDPPGTKGSTPPDPGREPAAPATETETIQLEPPTAAIKDPGDQAKVKPAVTAASLVAASRARIESWTSYQVELNRQERVGESLQEAEDVVLSIRRQPRAVRLEWPSGPHRGREVLYSATETNGLMQVNMADSAIPMPRLSLPPDSPLILRTSRHPITEAGFETILGNLQKTIDENGRGDQTHGRITYDGLKQPPALDHPCHKIAQVTANGETWQIFLDPDSKLPVLVEAHTAGGALLERYRFRNVTPDPPLLASAEAFDPNRRWGESQGLFGRLARTPNLSTDNDQTTR